MTIPDAKTRRDLARRFESPKTKPSAPGLDNVRLSLMDPKIFQALAKLSSTLTAAGVRHVVIGGIAVIVYGWPRITKDIDLLVGDEAFEHLGGGELRLRSDLPTSVDGVEIDFLPTAVAGPFAEEEFSLAFMTHGVPIGRPQIFVCTKLLRNLSRDRADLVEVLKAGLIDRAAVREYLETHAPMLTRRWDALVVDADEELEM